MFFKNVYLCVFIIAMKIKTVDDWSAFAQASTVDAKCQKNEIRGFFLWNKGELENYLSWCKDVCSWVEKLMNSVVN